MALLFIFPQILTVIKSLSPDNVARQIANTHTIFAIFAVLVMLPFSDYIVKLTQKLLPLKPEESRTGEERKLLYMTQTGTIPSAVAVSQAHREIIRMGEIASRNLKTAIRCFFELDDSLPEVVEETEDTVNYLDRSIISKLVELQHAGNDPTRSQSCLPYDSCCCGY